MFLFLKIIFLMLNAFEYKYRFLDNNVFLNSNRLYENILIPKDKSCIINLEVLQLSIDIIIIA